MSLPEGSGSRASSDEAARKPVGDDLFMLTLSENNKAAIFELGLTKIVKGEVEASQILRTLEKWDPDTRSLFKPRSASTILSTPFRLLFPLDDESAFHEDGFKDGYYVRQYMAVSYCWRSDDFLPQDYERHGSWPVSRPFVEAMLSEKDHPRVGIWMDQLCIIQTSEEDKRQSVAAMDIIYRSCIRVLVLLEDVFLDANEAALHIKYDASKTIRDPAWRPPAHEQSTISSFCRKVIRARWWQRAWCFHEYSVNEPWSVMRQRNEIHNATFIMNGPEQGSIVKIKWWTLYDILARRIDFEHEEHIHDHLLPIDHGDRVRGYRSSIMARHNTVSTKGCMLLEDRLSIMVNISGLALAYQGQTQQNQDEVLYASGVLALAAGETYPLTMFGGGALATPQGRPSWFQRHLLNEAVIPRFRKRNLGGIHRISMQEIELDMIFLSPPATWRDLNGKDLHPTYEIFPDTIATTPIDTHGPVSEKLTTASRSDEDLDKPRRRFLAGCLLAGHAFTARLWAQLETDVIEPNYNQGLNKRLAPKPWLLPAAKELIRQLFPVSSLLSIPTTSTFTCENAHLFLTWLTDPRSMYYIGSYTHFFPCSVGTGAFIMDAMVDTKDTDESFEELRAAIPIDLLDESCIPRRAWLLQPCNDKRAASQWRLVGKALLLGEPDLKTEAAQSDAAVELRRVVVRG